MNKNDILEFNTSQTLRLLGFLFSQVGVSWVRAAKKVCEYTPLDATFLNLKFKILETVFDPNMK
jgi:hypothetical protein